MPVGLALDTVTITRSTLTSDFEGNYTESPGAITTYAGMGTYGSVSASDRSVAAQRGQTVDATVALPLGVDVKVGDEVTVRSANWVVVEVRDVRLHQRVFIRSQI